MIKELEALEILLKAKQVCDVSCIEMCNNCQKKNAYNTIKKALLELKSIDSAEPSEALKMLDGIGTINLGDNPYAHFEKDMLKNIYKPELEVIKQTLIQAESDRKENELLKEIIKSLFDRGCPLHQYTDSKGVLLIEVDDECSIMHLGEFKGVDLDKKLKEVLE